MAALAAVAAPAACEPLPPPEDGSVLIGCERADERIEVTATSHLDPACTYTGGVDISTPDVTLDCQGATIRSAPGAGGRGIQIHTPIDVDLARVTVRNCHVDGFLNSVRVTLHDRGRAPGARVRATGHDPGSHRPRARRAATLRVIGRRRSEERRPCQTVTAPPTT